jgi:hypothetical protein
MVSSSASTKETGSNLHRQLYENHNLSHNYRRRRKADNGDHALRKAPNMFHTYLLFLFCTVSSVRAFAFLSIPRIVSLSRPTEMRPCLSRTTRPATRDRYQTRFGSFALFAKAKEGETSSEENEWRAIMAAFQMYKAAYGDLKVPLRFVVPSLAPWPGKSKRTGSPTSRCLLYESCPFTRSCLFVAQKMLGA